MSWSHIGADGGDNIDMNLKELWCGAVDWIQLA